MLESILSQLKSTQAPTETLKELKRLGLTHVVFTGADVDVATSCTLSSWIRDNGLPPGNTWSGREVFAVEGLLNRAPSLPFNPIEKRQCTPDEVAEFEALVLDVPALPALILAAKKGCLSYTTTGDFIFDVKVAAVMGLTKPSIQAIVDCWKSAPVSERMAAEEAMMASTEVESKAPVAYDVKVDPVELERLLLSMFSSSEMRRLVRCLPNGSHLASQLPGRSVSPRQTADAITEVVVRAGCVGALMAAMRDERPRRVQEIDALVVRYAS